MLRRTFLVLACWTFAVLAAFAMPAKGMPGSPILVGVFVAGAVGAGFAAVRAYPASRRQFNAVGMILVAGFLAVVVGVVYPVILGARAAASPAACLSHEKQLALSVILYAGDNDDHLPPAESWFTASQDHRQETEPLTCPSAESPYSYAFNRTLTHQKLTEMGKPDETVLTFEANAQTPNATEGPESLVPRHSGRATIAYADGHVTLRPAQTPLRWKP